MTLSPELQRSVDEARASLAAMSRDECIGCATLLRDVKPVLESERRREIAEDMARRFEARAAARCRTQSR